MAERSKLAVEVESEAVEVVSEAVMVLFETAAVVRSEVVQEIVVVERSKVDAEAAVEVEFEAVVIGLPLKAEGPLEVLFLLLLLAAWVLSRNKKDFNSMPENIDFSQRMQDVLRV